MSAGLQIQLDDFVARQALDAAMARGHDLKPMLRSIAAAGVASTRRRFQTKRAPDGSTWKRTDKPKGETMIVSRLLLGSISDRPPTEDSVSWGSNRVYAAQRQWGGTVRPVNGKALRFRIGGGFVTVKSVTQPARPYLGISAEDRETFIGIGLRHVAPLVGGAA